jgi:hypothetical protein
MGQGHTLPQPDILNLVKRTLNEMLPTAHLAVLERIH